MSMGKQFIPEAEGLMQHPSALHYTIRLRDCDRIRCLFESSRDRPSDGRAGFSSESLPISKGLLP